MNALADMKAAHARVTDSLKRGYAAIGMELAPNVADQIADYMIADLGIAAERQADNPGIRLVGKWETES